MFNNNLLKAKDKDSSTQSSRHPSPSPRRLSPPLKATNTPPTRSKNATPAHFKKSLRPYIHSILAFRKGLQFQSRASSHQVRRLSLAIENEGRFAAPLTPLFAGIAAEFHDTNKAYVAVAIHDSVYLQDFSIKELELPDKQESGKDVIADYVVSVLVAYERANMSKFIGAGFPSDLMSKSPRLCTKLWLDLDIVPLGLSPEPDEREEDGVGSEFWSVKEIDERADSMARKCIMHFGPGLTPLLQVGYRGIVGVDSQSHVKMLTLDDYRDTCGYRTWEAMMYFVKRLKARNTRIAFFSSTPQGGGVALMRHALVRLARLLGVQLNWYVPKPKPGVFLITKMVHNTLQGVEKPENVIKPEDKEVLIEWIKDNANRYWLSRGGPLRKPEEGGADVIIIDDPQMPGLIPLIKELTPDRPVLYRSHIQVRSDLCDTPGTPQADVWEFLWKKIEQADMFISHPMPEFVPKNVPREKVAYLPATTDWLDGLNKNISDWDKGYYGHMYNEECHALRQAELRWPARQYIIQVARFDPSKGIPDVIESYAGFRRLLEKKCPGAEPPQLVICGNTSVDDPDGTVIFDQTMEHIETNHPSLLLDISVMRLKANDQLLNTLLSSCHVALQLSTREGFEVKVSEALHKGKPIIATNAGGIPLQVQHGKNGYLVEPGDWPAVAQHLLDLWTNEELYNVMSAYAKKSVSDEVSTVGNMLSWLYLADEMSSGKKVVPNETWVNDMARAASGFPYVATENRLPGKLRTPLDDGSSASESGI
ncbi:glycosyltransferase family 4 protein [Xylogone sp. PMI_703]|nr:glycosyltransferase family 4 protein [Xylogone sp. PMI_703]